MVDKCNHFLLFECVGTEKYVEKAGDFVFMNLFCSQIVVDQKQPELGTDKFNLEHFFLFFDFAEVAKFIEYVLELLKLDMFLILQLFLVYFVDILL